MTLLMMTVKKHRRYCICPQASRRAPRRAALVAGDVASFMSGTGRYNTVLLVVPLATAMTLSDAVSSFEKSAGRCSFRETGLVFG